MQARFIIPGPLATVSGGYGYDRAIIAGLRGLGHQIDVCELGDPLAALNQPGLPIIDGLALPACATLAAEIAARPCVGLIHHPISLEPDMAHLAELENALFPAFARIIVTSDWTARALVEHFAVAADRIRVVQPGTAPVPRSAFRDQGCEILALGSLTPRKGHGMLLRSLGRLWDLDWHLTIAGIADDAAYGASLAALAAELNIADRVGFPGVLTGPALDTQWARTDLFALATKFEGYGMAIAESLAHGIPFAVTRGGAAGDGMPEMAGAVCNVDDQVTYSKTLRRLIFDTALRREMADAAWEAGQALPDWPAQVSKFAAALELS